jgi:hypothetical protein
MMATIDNLAIVASNIATSGGCMKILAVRLSLAALFVIVCGASAYLVWKTEARERDASQTFRTFESAAIAASHDVLELRAAQQAYVAAGQGEPFWIQRTATLTASLRDAIATLRTAASSPEAQSAADNASGALEDFEHMDRRAREYARTGQKLLASDLIFADGLEVTGGIAAAIDQARVLETQIRDLRLASARRLELAALGASAALGAVIALLLAATPRPEVAASTAEDVRAAAASTEPTASDLRLHLNQPPAEVPPPAPPVRSVDFSVIAALCGDLARVTDTRALSPVLERAAEVLDAPGIVLWIGDPDGRELTPIITHGYPQAIVMRLGTILTDAENATAAAFRTGLMQTVRADAVSNGAVAAPLVTPAGSVGVMAAEVRNGGETDSAKLAAATIVAAQLATLVGPPSTRAQARSEAV